MEVSEKIENDKKKISPEQRRNFLRKAAILTAAGAVGVLATQPGAKLLPRAQAADGDPLLIGAFNNGNNPGGDTVLTSHVNNAAALFVSNDLGGGIVGIGSVWGAMVISVCPPHTTMVAWPCSPDQPALS